MFSLNSLNIHINGAQNVCSPRRTVFETRLVDLCKNVFLRKTRLVLKNVKGRGRLQIVLSCVVLGCIWLAVLD